MSRWIAAPLVSLFLFSGFVVAWVNVTAICTMSSYYWTFNSQGQSPCVVAANMLSTCYSHSYTLAPLPPGGTYPGAAVDHSNKCECSTVGYSLISACVSCQGHEPDYWSTYTANCTDATTPPHTQFPNPVPAGIYVPSWATLDVTNENHWDSDAACEAVRDGGPEYGPGALIFGALDEYTSSLSTSSTSTSSSSAYPSTSSTSASAFSAPAGASSTSASPTPSPTSSSSYSGRHAGAVAGGAIGGITILSIAVTAIFYLRRRRLQAASAGVGASQTVSDYGTVAQSASAGVGASQTMPDYGTAVQSVPEAVSPLTMRLYDPNDPTTFPGYQGSLRSLDIISTSQLPLSSHVTVGSRSSLVLQTSSRSRDYRGLPMPSA